MQLSGVYNGLGGSEKSELHPPAPQPSEENRENLPGVEREPEAQSMFLMMTTVWAKQTGIIQQP